MMFKKIHIYFFILILTFNSANYKVFAYEGNENNFKKAILIYDKSSYFNYSTNTVSSIEQLIGHFPVSIKSININNYKKNDLKNYDFVFILGINGSFNNKEFLSDLSSFEKNIVWIGKGINDLLNQCDKYALRYLGEMSDMTELIYSNKRFFSEGKKEFSVLSTLSDTVKIHCKIYDGHTYYPFAVNYKNLWHISRVEENSVTFYILADLLYNIFEIPKKNSNKVFMCIDNVDPSTDIKKLREICDFLYSEHVPYMIAITPTYTDSKNLITISQNKAFIQTIQYLQNHDASIILNGYSPIKDGFEFWNVEKDEPMQIDMNSYIKQKISFGIKECVYNGIYPLAFKAPNYAIDSKGYIELKKYFSTYVGRFQSSNHALNTITYPYDVYNTKFFNKLVPENLGSIDSDNKISIDELLYKFNKISMVGDYTAGLVFYPYTNIQYIKETIYSLKNFNIKFGSLKQENNWVKYEGLIIQSDEGKVTFLDQSNILKEKQETKSKSSISIINDFFIVLIFVFCVVFFIIFYISKKRDKKKHLR